VTLAYIPQVEAKFLETRNSHEVRAELLQRISRFFFRTCMIASSRGVCVQVPSGASMRFSARVLQYVCDHPEERAIVCLKRSKILLPCTLCMIERGN